MSHINSVRTDHGFAVSRRALVLVSVALIATTSPTYASPKSRAVTLDAYTLAYDLRFAESHALLATARLSDGSDPAPARASAAVTWMEILFAQGVATFEAFEGQAERDTIDRPVVPPHLKERFLRDVQEALRLAESQLAARSQDVDAQYQVAATRGLLALYRGTVEGRTLAAFTEGRRAVSMMERIREGMPDHREAALIPGIYRYAVSTMSWPKRMLAAAAGMAGDRDAGIRLLETAASENAQTATDAALVLMIVYNREGRHADALRHLRQLQARHPRNRLLRLNAASTALAASQPAVTVREITDGLPAVLSSAEPKVLGERALWFFTRGAARVALSDPTAREDLLECLRASPREWVRARTHLELGKVALRSGTSETARAEFDAAMHYARRSGDHDALDAAKRLRRSASK
ncbi:MAG: hypothetical protein ABIS06_12775 [Vicinamibacterales bacterium]